MLGSKSTQSRSYMMTQQLCFFGVCVSISGASSLLLLPPLPLSASTSRWFRLPRILPYALLRAAPVTTPLPRIEWAPVAPLTLPPPRPPRLMLPLGVKGAISDPKGPPLPRGGTDKPVPRPRPPPPPPAELLLVGAKPEGFGGLRVWSGVVPGLPLAVERNSRLESEGSGFGGVDRGCG